MKELLEAGVHFGHQTKRWNPKMKEYIFGERNGIYIIDLGKTVKLFRQAEEFVTQPGRRRQARCCSSAPSGRRRMSSPKKRSAAACTTSTSAGSAACSRTSRRSSAASAACAISRRWSPTAATTRCRRKRSPATRKRSGSCRRTSTASGTWARLPDAIFIVDTKKEKIAVDEARKLKIPVIGIVDTNCDPDEVDFVIPGNDDALRAIRLFASKIADAVLGGRGLRESRQRRRDGRGRGRRDPTPARSSGARVRSRHAVRLRVSALSSVWHVHGAPAGPPRRRASCTGGASGALFSLASTLRSTYRHA